ncbi:hypothetical protein GUITHDRAFT_142632 [Guillardia theta CCMP2712]|uniref:Uncharacterized protein n=1 Tax=Guillardia theta (strain CCMP2712) TaxID=905079 RepID=L1IXE2_GUITC|nr:hypothetical protein GUITHDRAFT_142632 [Guillardia theta CCMP2712]EKX40520.1 hypothetical protein GUITHDRAFT_142632 [Guillardia theta CCMP2712]|eukprot:XP_005827500.1 hypothetical protein GUITHDRAFT_142632 [Guillardia theta CCMP2712]
MAACSMDIQPDVAEEDEKSTTQCSTSADAGPPTKKARTKEAEELLYSVFHCSSSDDCSCRRNTTIDKQKESVVLQSSPEALLGIFRQLTRNSTEAQREDDDNKSALLEILRLRHEYAMHPEGWVARKKRANREITQRFAQRWGVADSGVMRSRVGASYQAEVPEWQGECEYTPENLFATTSFVCPEGHKEEVVQAFLASLEPLYKVQQDAHEDYVLRRKAERISYRDIGTFREFACERLCANNFVETAARQEIERAMHKPEAFEASLPYEVMKLQSDFSQISHTFRSLDLEFRTGKKFPSWARETREELWFLAEPERPGEADQGPVLLMETWKGEEDGEDRVANHWLQVRCECKRWVRILDYLRYMYTVCQDCEKVLCICPACTTPISLPKGSHVKGERHVE